MHPGINRALINNELEKIMKMEEPGDHVEKVIKDYESSWKRRWPFSWFTMPSYKYEAATVYLKEIENSQR